MSLRSRLLGSLVLVWILMLAGVQWLWLPSWMEQERAALLRSDRQTVQVLADALVEPVLSGELSTVYALLQRQQKANPHWRLLELDDAFDRRLYPLEDDGSPRDPEWAWVDQDLVNEGRFVGHIHLGLDHASLLQQRLDSLHQALLGLTGVLFVALLILAWWQDRWVRRPVALVTEDLEALAQGRDEVHDLDTKVPEIRRLVDSFQVMRRTIIRRESDLLLHRQRLQAVLDSVHDAILVLSDDGLVVDANPAARRIFAYPREGLIGLPVTRLIPDLRLEAAGHSRLLATEEGHGLHRGQTSDGRELVMEVSVSLISSDDAVLYSILARDVSQRIERERRTRRLLGEVQAMIALVPGVVLRVDRQGALEWWNDRLTELCALDRHRLVNRRFLSLVHADDRERAERALNTALESGHGEFQARLSCEGRTSATHLFRLRRLDDEDGSLVLVGMDIEEQLATQRLLREARDQAESLARSRFYFLANASHEIRTPMNGVLGMLELLQDHVHGEGEAFLDAARRSGEHLLGLLNDLLDLSKLEADQLRLEPVDFSLSELVDDLVALFTPKAQEKGIELGWELDPGLPEGVRADRNRLWQILANLLGNAVKFTEAGHVILRAQAGGRPGEVRFEVEDTGIGIEPEAQRRIFEPFQQAADDTTRRFGGTGLGLALTRQLVERMGGRIGLDSRPGEGSRFQVELPLPPARVEVGQRSRPLSGRRVLVVDDLLANRRTAEMVLGRAGAQVEVAQDGHEALERIHFALADGLAYDALLVDLDLPGMDGLTLLERLKTYPELDSLQTFLMMRPGNDAVSERARALGVQGFIPKPLRREALIDAVAGAPVAARPVAVPRMERRLRGRVLLAEDNPVNQKVALAFLGRLGLEAAVAANGKEALRLWEEIQPDLILMDVQMPEMDGLQATALIREREGPDRHTPIVALTANALTGDEQACLDAGMDGYLSKPLKLERLEAELSRWLGGEGEQAQSASR